MVQITGNVNVNAATCNLPKPHGAQVELGHSVNGSVVSGVADLGSALSDAGGALY